MNKKLIPVVVLALGGALLLTLLFVELTNNGQPATEPAPWLRTTCGWRRITWLWGRSSAMPT